MNAIEAAAVPILSVTVIVLGLAVLALGQRVRRVERHVATLRMVRQAATEEEDAVEMYLLQGTAAPEEAHDPDDTSTWRRWARWAP